MYKKNLFVALPLPEAVQKKLLALAKALPERSFSSNLHLTLYFIGQETDWEAYAEALAAVREKAFEIRLAGLGTFGRKTLWAGLEASPALDNLHARIAEVMAKTGHRPEERAFKPHITLSRLKSPLSVNEKKALMAAAPGAAWRVDEFNLYESTLFPEGASHKILRGYALEKGGE